jgi:hypothetical protein
MPAYLFKAMPSHDVVSLATILGNDSKKGPGSQRESGGSRDCIFCKPRVTRIRGKAENIRDMHAPDLVGSCSILSITSSHDYIDSPLLSILSNKTSK